MKNWLIILLVAAVVAAGAFLPELFDANVRYSGCC